LALAGTANVKAQAPAAAEFATKARQAILVDADSGAVLFQHNADERMSPASMSKLMTLAVLFKALKSEQLRGTDEFPLSVNAWRKGGGPSGTSAMLIPVNSRVRIDELVLGIVVQSGNDAAIAVAEGMGGTEDDFARIMNEEARRLGMRNSTFRNATGLYHPDHLTTARDLATLAVHLIRDYPDYYALFSTREFRYRTHRFLNRNPLIPLNIGVDGLKTGFIKEAGYGIVASAKGADRRLVAVLNGLATEAERRDEGRRILEWGFKSFAEFRLFDPNEIVGQARVFGGKQFFVPVTGINGVTVILPRFPANQKLAAEIVYTSPLKAPIKKGDQIAKLRVTSTSKAVNEVPLFAAEDVEAGGLMRRGFDSLAFLALGWVR
jgi:D-alanyl-D-alanine carboxypeptidase (penicillin-binding protein 5/6)